LVFLIIFALSLAGTGFFYGQNPHGPDAPVLIEKNNPELGYAGSSDPSESSPDSDKNRPFYFEGVHFTPRLGYENTTYNQTGAPSLTQTSLRANLDLTWYLPRAPLEMGFRLNFTALPLVSNATAVTARFFGANVDLGYALVKTPFFKLTLLGGMYYTAAFVTDRSFGYPPLIFPELYPNLTFYLFNGVTVDATYRYVYLGSLFDASQTQIVRSIGLSVFINHNHSISALLEDNGFSLVFPGSKQVQYYSAGISLGYSF
jgi:hypothetical protein